MAERQAGPRTAVAGVAQVAVNVKDLARAVVFYRERLGMRLLFELPSAAFLQCGSTRIMLALPERAEFDHPASIVYYRVEDLDAAFGALVEAGVRVEEAPKVIGRLEEREIRMAFLRDTEGNLFGLTDEVG